MSTILEKLKKLEERTSRLDHSLGVYAKELQQTLRDQLAEERRRNEHLIFEIARLKANRQRDR